MSLLWELPHLRKLPAELFAACNSSEAAPANALSQAIAHLKAGELEEFREYLTGGENSEFFTHVDGGGELDLMVAAVHHFDLEVLEQEVAGEEANLSIRATNIAGDLITSEVLTFGNTLMYGLIGEAGTQMLLQELAATLRANDEPTRTEVVHVPLRKVDGNWLLVAPDKEAPATMFWQILFAFVYDD